MMFESLEELDKFDDDDEPTLEIYLQNSEDNIFNIMKTKIYWEIPKDKMKNDYDNECKGYPMRDDPYLIELIRKHGDELSDIKNVKFRIETIPKKYKNYYHVIRSRVYEYGQVDEYIDINYSRYYYDLNENRKRLSK